MWRFFTGAWFMIEFCNKSSLAIKEDVMTIIIFLIMCALSGMLLIIGWLTPVVELLAFYVLRWIRLLVWGVFILCSVGCLIMIVDWMIVKIPLPDVKWRALVVLYLLATAVPLIRLKRIMSRESARK